MMLIAISILVSLTLAIALATHIALSWLESNTRAIAQRESRRRFEVAEHEVYSAMARGDVVGLRQALDVYGEAAAKVE